MEECFSQAALLMKFCSGMLEQENKRQKEHQTTEMKIGSHGQTHLAGQYRVSILHAQMVLILIQWADQRTKSLLQLEMTLDL